MEFTTMERLQMKVSASYGAVIQFGDKVFISDCHWKGGFTAEIYEFVETPDETALGAIHIIVIFISTNCFNEHRLRRCWPRLIRCLRRRLLPAY